MNKIFLLTVIAFLFPIFLFSQEPFLSKSFDYQMGTPYEVKDADSKLYFPFGNEIIAVKVDKKDEMTLQKFSSVKLTELKRTEKLKLPDDAVLENIDMYKGHLIYTSFIHYGINPTSQSSCSVRRLI